MSLFVDARRQANGRGGRSAGRKGDFTLEIVAGGDEARALGRPMKTDRVFDVSQLADMVELRSSAFSSPRRPGTPLASINAELPKTRQMLAFEPANWRTLYGRRGRADAGRRDRLPNLGGPRRVRAGSARDYVLGFSAVNGVGEIWKAGGKVVKNVTSWASAELRGEDLRRLSALTEVSLKVMQSLDGVRRLAAWSCGQCRGIPDARECAELALRGLRRRALAGFRSPSFGIGAGRRGWPRRSPLEGPRPSVAYRMGPRSPGRARRASQ